MNTKDAMTVTVDHAPSGLISGDILHKSPCVFESLLKSAESDLDRRHEQIRSLKTQRAFLIAGLIIAFLLGLMVTKL